MNYADQLRVKLKVLKYMEVLLWLSLRSCGKGGQTIVKQLLF
jgi:hypothetical protein